MTRFILLLLSIFAPADDDTLVRRLGSDDWGQRDSADTGLRARGWDARHALTRGLASDDLEIRSRCAALRGLALSDAVDSLGPLPMLDALWYDTSPPHPGYKENLNPIFMAAYAHFNPYLKRLGRDGYPYHNYYMATDMALRDLLEWGVPPEALRPVLAEMRRRDAVFLGATRTHVP